MKLKCVLLYDDSQGLGHLPFFRYLCDNLSEVYEVHIFTGSGISQDSFLGVKCITLPDREMKTLYHRERINLINRYIHNIDPDIFLIDYFPFGRFGNILEIQVIESYIHKKKGKTISFMRDIYRGKNVLSEKKYNKFIKIIESKKGSSICEIVHTDLLWLYKIVFHGNIDHIFLAQIFLDYFVNTKMIDAILVFGDKKIFDIRSEFVEDIQNKDIWYNMGYIPLHKPRDKKFKNKKRKILISSGGNITSKVDFIDLIKFMISKTDYEIRILIGPYVLQELRLDIQDIVREHSHITLSGFNNHFQSLLDESHYYFGFGGYGTFQHLFHYSGSAFIMANYNLSSFRHRYYEQKYRTKLFENILNVSFLDDFSNEYLELCLNDYAPKTPSVENIDFCNQERLINTIENIYNQ